MAPRTAPTRQAMEEIGRRMAATQPETVIVITPHGVRVAGSICVMVTERAIGMLEGEQQAHVEIDMAVDTELAHHIALSAAQTYHVPVVTAIYGASGGDGCYTLP